MNLHGIVSTVISAVNPQLPVTLRLSTGTMTTLADGTRVPAYQEVDGVFAQVQAQTYKDIQQLDSLNLQGTRKVVYLSGEIDGLVRATSKGGDLITFPDGSVWLVALVLEQWPDWVKAAITLQNSPPLSALAPVALRSPSPPAPEAQMWIIKSANYAASPNDQILADTSAGPFTITLPAQPSNGTSVNVNDAKSTWATNNLTVAGNGANIGGSLLNFVGNINGLTLQFLFVGGTVGWQVYL